VPDLTGQAIVAAACILGAAALAIGVRVSKTLAGVLAVLLAAAPLLGVICQVWR